MKTLLLLFLLTTAIYAQSADPVRQSGPDETLYGKCLSYRKIENVGPCAAAEVMGNRLYAIGQGNLYVLDITRPREPRLLGTLAGLGTTRQLVIRNHLAYITARQDGLWIVDVSDPAKPTLVSHYDTVEMATGIWVSGGLAFIATRCYGVETVDVSDPRHPRHISTLKTGEAQSCWARDGLLYIGDWAPKKLLIADMKNPRQPVIVGEGLLDGYGDGGCLRGKYCFAATGHHSRASNKEEGQGKGHGLEIFEITDPARPVFVSRVKFPALYSIYNDMWTSRVAGDHCVVADTHNGLFVVAIRDIAKPTIVAQAHLPPVPQRNMDDAVGGIALADGVIYAAGVYTGLYVVSAPGLASPVIPESDLAPILDASLQKSAEDSDFHVYRPDGQVYAVNIKGDIAWAACGAAGIQAVRMDDLLKPVAVHREVNEVYYLSCRSNRLFTAEGAAGMGIYEIGAAFRLTELGRFKIPGKGIRQVMVPEGSRFALIHCGGPTAYIVDLLDLGHPRLALSDSQVGLFYGDQLVDKLFAGRYLVAYWQRSGPAWYDISGVQPVLAGNTPDTSLYGWTDGACAFGESLLITKHRKYCLLSVNERRNASDLPSFGITGVDLAGRPSTDGTRLAISSRHNRTVKILDVADITHPRLLREYALFGHPGACAFWKDRAVIPAGYQGLLLEQQPSHPKTP